MLMAIEPEAVAGLNNSAIFAICIYRRTKLYKNWHFRILP
jgi:hypothetical protein